MRRCYIFILLLFIILLLVSCSSNKISINEKSEIINIMDYFPREQMVKVFNGGFENEGTVYIIDRIEGDKIQVKKIDSGTGGVYIYKVSNQEIKLIYYSGENDFTGQYEEDFLNKAPNRDLVILKAPLKIGSKIGKWNVTDINVKIDTPAGAYETLQLTTKRDDMEHIVYYAKEIGSVKRVLKFDDGIELIEELVKVEKLNIKNELSNEELHEIVDKYLNEI